MRRVALAALLAAAVAACQDPARAPIPLAVTAEPAAQTAGGLVTLTSAEFAALVLIPASDTTPNRWSNFAVIVGNDTAESWRIGLTQIAYRVPPVLTGNYDVIVRTAGHDVTQIPLFAIGLAREAYWGGLNPYTGVNTGTLLPGRGVLVAEGSSWPGYVTGYGLLDVQRQSLRILVPALANRVKMHAPGLSYRPNHFIFDVSPAGTAAATVWRADPWTLVDSLPCGVAAGGYTAVELSATTCLSFRWGALVRNGTDTLLPPHTQMASGEFRLSPGGKWVVLRTELYGRVFGPMRWPVIDQTGTVAYTIDTLYKVTGAAFSRYGDTLFVTAGVEDEAAPFFVGARFSLVLLETATGRVLASRAFGVDQMLQDVILDPVRPYLYVGHIRPEPGPYHEQWRQYLTVLDRRTLEIVADIPAAADRSPVDASLVYQGSAGQVSVVGWCGFDCGGLWVFTFDLP